MVWICLFCHIFWIKWNICFLYKNFKILAKTNDFYSVLKAWMYLFSENLLSFCYDLLFQTSCFSNLYLSPFYCYSVLYCMAVNSIFKHSNSYKHLAFLCFLNIFVLSHQAGWLPELLCHSLMPCSSPKQEGVVSRNKSTAPLSNTGFFGSVRWWGLLFPSAPRRVTIT